MVRKVIFAKKNLFFNETNHQKTIINIKIEHLNSMKIKPLFFTLLLLSYLQLSNAQVQKELALIKAQSAISLINEQKIDEGIKLLKESVTLDPENYNYAYELGYAYFLKEDYKNAIIILESIKEHKEVTTELFEILGKSYEISMQRDDAISTYYEGLSKFPLSGMLYFEKGNLFWSNKNIGEALRSYEKGIEVEPDFASNYYRACLIYISSNEEVWGMIYGEIFMNLERSSKRTGEISKLLYDTYKSEIKFSSVSPTSVSFSKSTKTIIKDNQGPELKQLPFGTGIYEPLLLQSVFTENQIDMNSLDRIRQNFVNLYFKTGNNTLYPNTLFDYQFKVYKAGHMEAYNHWLLRKGNPAEFDTWFNTNEEKWDNFIKWFRDNRLKIDSNSKFSKKHYEK